jgi:hypothetical protein
MSSDRNQYLVLQAIEKLTDTVGALRVELKDLRDDLKRAGE